MINKSMHTYYILFCIFILTTCPSISAQMTKAQIKAKTNTKITMLKKAVRTHQSVHKNMLSSRNQIEDLRHQATINFQNNAYKIYLKGVLDIYDKVSKPGTVFNEALGMSIEVFKNMVWEPALWRTSEQHVPISRMHENALRRNGKINRLLGDLKIIMQSPLKRFDDDQNPLRSAKAWWRDADGIQDDEVELTTRKLFIIKNLSEKIVLQMDWEMKTIRAELKLIKAEIERLEKTVSDDIPRANMVAGGNYSGNEIMKRILSYIETTETACNTDEGKEYKRHRCSFYNVKSIKGLSGVAKASTTIDLHIYKNSPAPAPYGNIQPTLIAGGIQYYYTADSVPNMVMLDLFAIRGKYSLRLADTIHWKVPNPDHEPLRDRCLQLFIQIAAHGLGAPNN